MLRMFFPFLSWIKGYDKDSLKMDFLSGLTVALVLIPQSMAYAQLAGMPSYYGLYAAFLPPMIAALFGSSRQLATGPVAIVSLMTAASLEPLATTGSAGYISYAILLAFMIGVFQLALGILRLGLVVNFLSHPVVNGFTNAAALIIASSQLSKLFGVHVDKSEHHYETIINVCRQAAEYLHWPTLAMGVLAFAIMYGLKKFYPRVPNVLAAVVITTLLSWAIGFEQNGRFPVESIQNPEIVTSIFQFNKITENIRDTIAKRAETEGKLDQIRALNDPIAVAEAENQLHLINTKIALYKEEVRAYRKQLRAFLFTGVVDESGNTFLYEKDRLPQGRESDGKTWRIKVGNTVLDTESLLLTSGGDVVGKIPQGIPSISFPTIDGKIVLRLLPFAVIISLLGFMEAISIAKAMAAKTGQRLDPNQELIGQGLGNILGSCGQSYPTSGSFSRSAVNLQAGARTGLSSVFTSMIVVVVLFFFTPLLYHLPQAVLAAVIMMAVLGLINVSGFVHAWRAQWYDGVISVISFLATLIFAPHLDKGIMVGVFLSVGVFLYKSMRPMVRSLSRHDDDSFRCIVLNDLEECKYMGLVRFEGPLFFANASYLEDQINDRLMAKQNLKHIIIDASGINDMDASGEETLSLLVDTVRSSGRDISLSTVNESVMKVLGNTYLLEKIGEDHIYSSMETAINDIHKKVHDEESLKTCPLVPCTGVMTYREIL